MTLWKTGSGSERFNNLVQGNGLLVKRLAGGRNLFNERCIALGVLFYFQQGPGRGFDARILGVALRSDAADHSGH